MQRCISYIEILDFLLSANFILLKHMERNAINNSNFFKVHSAYHWRPLLLTASGIKKKIATPLTGILCCSGHLRVCMSKPTKKTCIFFSAIVYYKIRSQCLQPHMW